MGERPATLWLVILVGIFSGITAVAGVLLDSRDAGRSTSVANRVQQVIEHAETNTRVACALGEIVRAELPDDSDTDQDLVADLDQVLADCPREVTDDQPD